MSAAAEGRAMTCFNDRGLPTLAIRQDARQLQDLGQPATILFPLYLDLEGNHALRLSGPRSYDSCQALDSVCAIIRRAGSLAAGATAGS